MLYELKDAEGNVIDIASLGSYEYAQTYVGNNIDGTLITSVERLPAELRREDRTEVFSRTIDNMNTLWYNSLTAEQQSSLSTWRDQWLSYPNNEDATRPTLPEGIF